MNNADDSTPDKDILPDQSDLGPEPDWLLDDDEVSTESESPTPLPGPPVDRTTDIDTTEQPLIIDSQIQPEFVGAADPPNLVAGATGSKSYPWLWSAVPLVLLLATALIAWFGATQTLNGLATWEAIRSNGPALLPARWAMTIWWAVVPLMAIFLIYGALPTGRQITRIKPGGPLISIALVSTGLWIIAQHWDWEVIGIVTMAISALALFVTYLLVVLGPNITNLRQRIVAVMPLSAALGYSVMLTVLSWQSYSSQPFGERGSSALFALFIVMIAAVFAFFLRDGLFALVLAIWFAGVVHQQWGEDAVISLVAAVAALITGALAGLGTILATESPRPSLTTSVQARRGRTSFFRKSKESDAENLP